MTITQASRTAQDRNSWRTTINGLPMQAYTLPGIKDEMCVLKVMNTYTHHHRAVEKAQWDKVLAENARETEFKSPASL